jgi:hypothetical protein
VNSGDGPPPAKKFQDCARHCLRASYLHVMQFQPAIPTRGTKVPAFVGKEERHAASDMQ